MKITAILDGVFIEYASGRRVEIHFGGYGIRVISENPVKVKSESDDGTQTYLEFATAEENELSRSGTWILDDHDDLPDDDFAFAPRST